MIVFYSWGCQGGECKVLCTGCVLLASPYALGSAQLGLARSRSGVCVCSRGGIAVPWWGDLHIQLSAAHDWVLFGGRAMLSLRSFTFRRREMGAACVGYWSACFESGPRVGQEGVKSGPILGELDYACNQWWVKGRSRAGPERVNSGPCMAPEWAEHRL